MSRYGLLIGFILLCVMFSGCTKNNNSTAPTAEPTPSLINYEERIPPSAGTDIISEKEEAVRLVVKKESYTMQDGEIEYSIINQTGKDMEVLLIPKLEIYKSGIWTEVKCDGGFCGVKDLLPDRIDTAVELAWYPQLESGRYRLSFTVTQEINGQKLDKIVSDEFSFTDQK